MNIAVFDKLNFWRQLKTGDALSKFDIALTQQEFDDLKVLDIYQNETPQYVFDGVTVVRKATQTELMRLTGIDFEYVPSTYNFINPKYYNTLIQGGKQL